MDKDLLEIALEIIKAVDYDIGKEIEQDGSIDEDITVIEVYNILQKLREDDEHS